VILYIASSTPSKKIQHSSFLEKKSFLGFTSKFIKKLVSVFASPNKFIIKILFTINPIILMGHRKYSIYIYLLVKFLKIWLVTEELYKEIKTWHAASTIHRPLHWHTVIMQHEQQASTQRHTRRGQGQARRRPQEDHLWSPPPRLSCSKEANLP